MALKCFTINTESRSGERKILWEMIQNINIFQGLECGNVMRTRVK